MKEGSTPLFSSVFISTKAAARIIDAEFPTKTGSMLSVRYLERGSLKKGRISWQERKVHLPIMVPCWWPVSFRVQTVILSYCTKMKGIRRQSASSHPRDPFCYLWCFSSAEREKNKTKDLTSPSRPKPDLCLTVADLCLTVPYVCLTH